MGSDGKPSTFKMVVGVVRAFVTIARRKTPPDMHGQVVLITGGSRGLGLAMAEEFALQGARLVLAAQDEQELEEARRQLAEQGAPVLAIPCDMTNREQVQHLIDQATEHYGRIDILVNNAGITTVGPVLSQTLNDFEDSMNIIFWGAVYATLAVLPQMVERKQGCIVNISSIGGKVSVPHLLPYSSGKFALTGFSEGLHAELAKEGIQVVTVTPGLMRTGSPVNALFKGKHHAEYTWFSISDSLPFLSTSAKLAAQHIVHATQKRRVAVTLTIPAKMLAFFHGMFPQMTIRLLSIVNRLLPDAGAADGFDSTTGRESETRLSQSFLTTLGRKAAQDYNEDV
ncbi:ketoacyl reductase [Dictyobacter sp. S3.2.2.5]|uniref:Ketoacyl reductase n=1 Tax=Dictyobacter halimunensis TaxID=3026934 RepID=A0ABQ6G2C8_9CHLR|nr:ketoacyl reductase [Dictyobacter sp. S3.2.2.5]